MPSGFYTDHDPADFYVWTPPGKPLSIHVRLELVKRLEDDYLKPAAQSTRQELAGVLLGYSLTTPQPASFIEDFVVLHERDEANQTQNFRGELLAQKLGALARRAGLQQTPIGFFRWQRGGWLSLSDRDVEAADRYFARPQDIILLIRYSGSRGTEGAFFWREGGAIRYRDAHYEFPFNAAKLSLPSAPAAPSLALPAPAVGAQALEVSPQEPPPNQPHQVARWLPVVHTAAIAMILTGAGVAALETTGSSGTPLQRAVYESPLGLHATAQAGLLAIQWNRQAPVIADAQSAVLRVIDGLATDVTQLDSRQLQDGYAAYRPATTDVEVRLEVKARDGRTVTESVRFLGSTQGR